MKNCGTALPLENPLLTRRLIINLGKGGVGKSVVSAAMAITASKRGFRTLLCQLNTKDYISEYLGTRNVTSEIQELLPNLFCVNITPDAALREYVLLQMKLEVIYKIVFKNRVVNSFLKAVPALSDLVMIGKVEHHVLQEKSDGSPLYEVVIVDAPPTGHGMFFLSVPKVMAEAARSGPIHDHSLRMFDLLRDTRRCAVNLVTLPEEMPVSEAIDANIFLRRTLGITPSLLIMNRCYLVDFDADDEQTIEAILNTTRKNDMLFQCLSAFRDDIIRTRQRLEFAEKCITTLDIPAVRLPDLTSLRFSRDEIEELSEYLEPLL